MQHQVIVNVYKVEIWGTDSRTQPVPNEAVPGMYVETK